METMYASRCPIRSRFPHPFRAAALAVLLTAAVAGTARAQQQTSISGTVTSAAGGPLGSVVVRVQGSDSTAVTDETGHYRITAPAAGVLTFTRIGFRPVTTEVGGRATIDVRMERVAFLEEVVVTAYTEQRRANITGAVASVDLEATARQTSASMLKRLDVAVPGVTVEGSGSPGSRSTVRIRGISSFQNNDPLYIVDGTPVQDSYINWLNPNDIESIQILKDASAASIYGARASNGVVVIETTKRNTRGAPTATLRLRTGVSTPVRGYDDFLITDALEYFEVVKLSYQNAGLPVPTNIYGDPNNPSIPQYTYASPNVTLATDQWGRPSTVNLDGYAFPNALIMPGSPGTNWWDAVFSTGSIADVNLDVHGGGEDNRYAVSFNYFDQNGTARYNRFQRGSVRVNTAFDRGRFSFGENLALALDRSIGGVPNDPGTGAEGGILGKNILMQPVVPIYDVRGNFASGKAVGLGNNTNPLKIAYASRDNANINARLFGNVFAGYQLLQPLRFTTRFGFNLGQGSFVGFNAITPENSEPTFTNSISESTSQFTDWTWSNTLQYTTSLERHSLSVLLGQEANRTTNRFISGGMSNLISEDPDSWYLQDALGDATTKNVFSGGSEGALLSFFGRADYNYDERYVLSFTLRRDGSSRLSPDNRWGTFPAFGVGWRLSNEAFFPRDGLFTDVMLRFGWGVTGNQAIPAGRIVSQFGGSRGDTYYDIGGTNNSLVAGFRQTSLGNPDLKWEENQSINVGADVAMLDGALNVVVDVYSRDTDNLLFDPRTPGTAGVAAPPIVNIGRMSNRGIDMSISYAAASWTLSFNGSHYRNEIERIDGVQDFFYGPISTRFGNQVINKVGHPIGSFFGYLTDGFFQTQAEADAATVDTLTKQCPSSFCQDGAAPGRFRFKDVNGDGSLTLADRTIIGDPHPDFTAGLDFTLRRGAWDFSATLFGTFGNDIFDVQKEFYVFRNFSTNVRRDLLANSWTPERPNAKYPRLDVNDNFSRALSDFYVEDGSYVRLRNVQVGYNLPRRWARWTTTSRVYVQVENLFTLTGYDGLDPALPAANVFGPAGDVRDQYRGVDRGVYPSNRTFSIGLVTTF